MQILLQMSFSTMQYGEHYSRYNLYSNSISLVITNYAFLERKKKSYACQKNISNTLIDRQMIWYSRALNLYSSNRKNSQNCPSECQYKSVQCILVN